MHVDNLVVSKSFFEKTNLSLIELFWHPCQKSIGYKRMDAIQRMLCLNVNPGTVFLVGKISLGKETSQLSYLIDLWPGANFLSPYGLVTVY